MSEYKNKYNKVNETGKEYRKFETGSQRDSAEGKGRQDLIPPYPLKRLAVHYENGAKKYGDRNWEIGQPVNEYYNSAFRHLTDWMGGDNTEDHLSAVVWNIFGMIHTIEKVQQGLLVASLISELPEQIQKKIINEAPKRGGIEKQIAKMDKIKSGSERVADEGIECDCQGCMQFRRSEQ